VFLPETTAEGSLLLSSGPDCTPRRATIPVRIIHGKARVLPVDETGGQMGVDELFLQKEPNHRSTEILRHPLDVAEGDMDKLAPIVKPALQQEAMKVWVPSQKLAAALV
jgi:hypothetical protein